MTTDGDGKNGNRRPIVLGESYGLEANLLGVPIYTLNSSSTVKSLSCEWTGSNGELSIFQFERPDDVPFPLLPHAELFFTAIAMFTQQPVESGDLYFRLIDIAKNAGRESGRGIFNTIKEMIWRYSRCQVHFHESWRLKDGKERYHTWHGPLILAENVFKSSELKLTLKKNPKNSLSKEKWHSLKLHPMVVQSVKNSYVRYFLTENLQSDLSDEAKAVYRYFFSFSDKTSVFRSYEQLMSVFPWRSGKKRFCAWLDAQLNELTEAKPVEHYRLTDTGVYVKSTPIALLKKKTKPQQFIDLTDDDLLGRFDDLRANGLIKDASAEAIQCLLFSNQKGLAVKQLRRAMTKTLGGLEPGE